MKKILFPLIVVLGMGAASCSQNDGGITDLSNLYVPVASDTTATANLDQLTQGRSLYIQNCNACHQLYSPDRFSVSKWKRIIPQMGPRTNMSDAEIELITKYLCKGNN